MVLGVLSNPNNSMILSLIYLEKLQLSTASLNVTRLMSDIYELQVLEQNIILYYPITNCKSTSRGVSLLSVTQDLHALTSQL